MARKKLQDISRITTSTQLNNVNTPYKKSIKNYNKNICVDNDSILKNNKEINNSKPLIKKIENKFNIYIYGSVKPITFRTIKIYITKHLQNKTDKLNFKFSFSSFINNYFKYNDFPNIQQTIILLEKEEVLLNRMYKIININEDIYIKIKNKATMLGFNINMYTLYVLETLLKN